MPEVLALLTINIKENEMDCRHMILINTRWLWVKIRTRADYRYIGQITLREWLSPKRYEVGLMRRTKSPWGYRYWLNKSTSHWD